MLSDRYPNCHVCPVLTVFNFRVLWPNGRTDQVKTWHAGRPRPWPHCVRCHLAPPPEYGHSPQFSAHICCGPMAAWIKMPLGMEVGLGPGDFVLDGDPAPSPKRGRSPLPNYRPIAVVAPNGWMHQDATRCHLLCCLSPGDFVLDVNPASLSKKGTEPPKFSAHVYCGQTPGWIKMVLGM